MSSLLQHRGRIDNRGVELLFYLVKKGKDWEKYNGPNAYKPNPDSTSFCDDVEPITLLDKKGKERQVQRLYRIWRKPVGMWGCWVVFRYLGKENVPDLSCPIATHKLPRGAESLTNIETANVWFN